MKHIKKTSSPPMLVALLAGAALLMGLVSQSALAVGTAAGTTISNSATIQYDVGGTALYVCSSDAVGGNSVADSDGVCVEGVNGASVTSFLVDDKVDLLVTEVGGTWTVVSAGQVNATTTFTVLNEGNATHDFSLAIGNAASLDTLFGKTDNFDATGCTVSNITTVLPADMGTYTAADQHINALVADKAATVTVSCNIPAVRVNNDAAIVSLTATALNNDNGNLAGSALVIAVNTKDGVEIVLGDGAGSEAGDTAGDGDHSARDVYFVQTAQLTVTKDVTTLCDPVDGNASPNNIPGAVVRWTITIQNTGAASATLTSFTDAIPTNTTFDPDLITGAGAGAACEFAAGGAGAFENANTRGVRIQNSVARAMAGTAGGAAATSSYFIADAADANGDGVSSTGGVVVNFGTAFPALGGYAAGELKAGETVTVYFNVGIN